MQQIELELQAAATRAFILADAEDINLVRAAMVSDGAGGFVETQPPISIAPQVARLIPQSDQVPEIEGSDGRRAVPKWVILMEPGSDIQKYDKFVWRGRTWEIAEMHDKPDYEMKGDVILYA
jgi:hypothetical protein